MTASLGGSDPAGSLMVKPPSRRTVSAFALVVILAGAALLQQKIGERQALLFLIGCSFGFVLFATNFSFTRAWRRLVAERRGAEVRAQILMLAIASLLILPLAYSGSALGRPVVGAIAPLGVSVAVGGFLFAAGMQLAGACASGLLYSIGAGSARMLVVLVFFVIGSLFGSWHLPWWLALPKIEAIDVASDLGLASGMVVQFGLLGALAFATIVLERRKHGVIEPAARMLLLGALALALGNALTLIVAGHPWTTTFAFALWGAKFGGAVGWPIAEWTFWTWPYPARALDKSILFDVTSVMNAGIVAGALLAAGMTGRFAPQVSLRAGALLASALGGLAMGYGARLGFGCNIGAYFSGIASGSLHGWLWLLAALAGTAGGLALRPWFGLAGAPTSATFAGRSPGTTDPSSLNSPPSNRQ